MGRKPKTGPSFIKFLLHPHHFAHNLPIPPRFVTKYLGGGKIKLNAMLVTNESVKSWPVMLVDIGGKYCFKLGWSEFVKENNLETGDFLLFWLIGHSTFFVAMYSPSGIEKKITSSSAATNSSTKRTFANSILEPEQIDYTNCKSKKRKVEEASECMHQAATFVEPLHNPFFKVIIDRNSMNRLWFLRETGLLASMRSMGMLMLRDVAGREWQVKIVRRKSTYGYHFTSGWFSFRNANKIEKGDTCLFRFLQSEGNVLHVEVLNRKGSKSDSGGQKEGDHKTGKVKEGGDGGYSRLSEATSSVKEMQRALFFKARLGRSCNYRMGLPIWFARKSGLASRRDVMLIDEMGREYPVIIRTRYKNPGYDLVTGWASLLKANKMEKGDICLFRLFRDQGDVIHVKVIQKKVPRRRKTMNKGKTSPTT